MRGFWLYVRLGRWLVGNLSLLSSLTRNKDTQSPEEYMATYKEVGRQFSVSMVEYTGSTVNVEGIDNIPEGAVLFVSNHPSLFDIAMFLGYIPRPAGFIAKAEISKIPILKRWMLEYNCIFLDRSNLRQSAKAINEGIAKLKSGISMIIFPEGTRSRGREMLEFKHGSFKLATKAKVPIVPVTMDGTHEIFETGDGKIHAANIKVTIHEPIETRDLTSEELTELPDKVWNIVASKLGQ